MNRIEDIDRQLHDRFGNLLFISIISRPFGDHHAAMIGLQGKARAFPFQIGARSSGDVSADLVKQIVDWMTAAGATYFNQ